MFVLLLAMVVVLGKLLTVADADAGRFLIFAMLGCGEEEKLVGPVSAL
jgi:hypothetical protein